MAGEWRETTLDQLGRIVTGKTPPSSQRAYFGGDILFVTPTDMDGRRIIDRTARYLTEQGADVVSGCRLSPNSVMVSCIGSDMGKVAVAGRNSVTNQQINSIVVDSGDEPLFVYYNLSTRKEEIRAVAGGSAQPILNKSAFGQLPILLPPLSEQRVIAHILGTLDDKIELNRRMNDTLEAIARALFKSWFVDATQAGLPKGWREGKVEELLALSREIINPSDFLDETFDHYSIPSFDEGRLPKAETGKQIQSNKFLVPPGAVMISKLNPRIPRVWLPNVSAKQRSVASTEFLVAIPKPGISREWLYALFSSEAFLDVFATLVTGTSGSHQRVKPEYLLAMDLGIPLQEHIAEYTALTKSLHERFAANLEESRTLVALRDTLLPKLISGELRVMNWERVARTQS